MRYDYKLLRNYCDENKITLVEDYENKKVIRDTIIKGKCLGENCQESFEKNFRLLYQSGGYCKKCTEKNRIENIKKNNLEKYGVEWTSQLESVKEKFKKTSLGRYGYDNVAKAPEIKEKIKETFREKYGYDSVFQSEKIKEAIRQTNLKKYGSDHIFKVPEIREKVRQTFLAKYGYDNPQKCPEIQEKTRQTNIERYGTEYISQNEEIKEKIKETNLRVRGVEYPTQCEEVKERVRQTNLRVRGVEYSSQSQEIKDKIKENNLKKYGTEYPCQNPEIMERSQKYRFYDFIFPSGNKVKVQGYEKYALRDLLEDGYDEKDIAVSKREVPKIAYIYEDKQRYHFPDFFIPKENKIIEVKSTWTLDVQYDKVMAKMASAINEGFQYEI